MNKDMDFLLGIFVGLSLAITWGIYLNNKRKKEQDKEVTKMVDIWVRSFHKNESWSGTGSVTLYTQLQDAIDREDYAAAARLRDLINKK